MKDVLALLRLLRPLNLLIIAAGVGLGGWLAGGAAVWTGATAVRLLVAGLAAGLIGAAANSINDVFDREIDRVNRPERPLPSGRVSVRTAVGIGVGASAAGVALAFGLSAVHGAVALAAVGLLALYNARLKHVAVAGNVVVAAVVALTLVFGGWAVGPAGPALVGAAFAFLTTLAREIVKDAEDRTGDAAAGARTLPLVAGLGVARGVALAVVAVTLLLTPMPFLAAGYGGLYLLLMLPTDALLLRAGWLLLLPAPALAGASRTLKGAMAAGILALALGVLPGG